MSKPLSRFTWISLVFFVCLFATRVAKAQSFEAEIVIDAKETVALVNGRFDSGGFDFTHVNLSFEASIAGQRDIARRIRRVEILDGHGTPVPFRKLIDSEYLAEAGVVAWKYEVDLTPLKGVNAAAHTSWVSGNRGLIMLADILPTGETKGKVTLRVPAGWNVFTTEPLEAPNVFRIADSSRAVFAIGPDWQRVEQRGPTTNIDILVFGERHFTSSDAGRMAAEIFASLRSVLGDNGDERRQVILSNFPAAIPPGNWEAETRGKSVTIISSDMQFRTQSLQRLHEQLRHELFHLWIPNGVNLTGNYDWFYEGFALYQSLKLAVSLNRIRFEDFLDTLSRAHTIDSAQSQRISLIQASANRFAGSNTQVYARGMLVAFLTDIASLRQSKGKRTVEDLLKVLYMKHRKPAPPEDGNAAVIELIKARTIGVEKYITGVEKIEWASDLAAAGIEDSDPGLVTTLRVKQKLNGGQKAVLDKLGYNNWRKISGPSK